MACRTKELRIPEYPGYLSWFLNCLCDEGHCWGTVLHSWVPKCAVSSTLEYSLTFNMGLQNLEGGIWNRGQWMFCEGKKPSYSNTKFNQLGVAASKGALEYLCLFLSYILLPVGKNTKPLQRLKECDPSVVWFTWTILNSWYLRSFLLYVAEVQHRWMFSSFDSVF